jgi:hypothetical protein
MSHDHGTHERRSPAAWWITAGITIVIYAIGVIGFWQLRPSHHDISSLDPFYYAFQLFLIEPPHLDPPDSALVEIARWGALAIDMFAAFVVGRRMFAQEIARARLRRARNHFVVSARPHDARAIAAAVRRRHPGALVAILDGAPRSQRLIEKTARHTYVVPGDVRSAAPAVQLHEAAEVIVAGPDDGENLAAAAEVAAIANTRRTMGEPLVCQVQIQGVGVRETLKRANTAANPRGYARAFDHFERAVTRLFTRDLPLDGGGIARADDTDVHVVIIGHGDWALAVACAAARIGHFANGRPLRLSVITADEAAWVRHLGARFDVVSGLVRHEVLTAGPQTPEGAQWLRAAARMKNTRLLVVIAPASDADAIELEAAVREAVRGTAAGVAVRLQHSGLAGLVREGGRLAGVDVVPFGWLDESAWAGLLEYDEREDMAKLVQRRFAEFAKAQGRKPSTDKAVAAFPELELEDFKESNRQQVDHLWVKLRAVGCEVAEASDTRPAAVWLHDEIEVMSEMEHNRWAAERLLNGWRLGDRNEQERTSPHLIPWDKLDEKIKDYDRQAVTNIPELLRASGNRKICRR